MKSPKAKESQLLGNNSNPTRGVILNPHPRGSLKSGANMRIFFMLLCLLASAAEAQPTGKEWFEFTRSSSGDSSFTDITRIKRDPYGMNTYSAWWRYDLHTAEKYMGQTYVVSLSLYRVDCNERSAAQLSQYLYNSSRKVVWNDLKKYAPEVAVPQSSGESFVNTICLHAQTSGL